MKKFNVNDFRGGAKVITRNGLNAKIVSVNMKGNFPVAAIVPVSENEDRILMYTEDGAEVNGNHQYDLFTVETEKYGYIVAKRSEICSTFAEAQDRKMFFPINQGYDVYKILLCD